MSKPSCGIGNHKAYALNPEVCGICGAWIVEEASMSQKLQPPRCNHPARYTMADLTQRAQRNVMLQQCLTALTSGFFLSFEECLITTICHLADQNEHLIQKMTDLALHETKSFIVPEKT